MIVVIKLIVWPPLEGHRANLGLAPVVGVPEVSECAHSAHMGAFLEMNRAIEEGKETD